MRLLQPAPASLPSHRDTRQQGFGLRLAGNVGSVLTRLSGCSRASAGSVRLLDDALRCGIGTVFASFVPGQPMQQAAQAPLEAEYSPEALDTLTQVPRHMLQ